MILPPNASKQEQTLVDVIDYPLDTNSLRGFRFNHKNEMLPLLIAEYGLGEVLPLIPNKKAIQSGIKFQRLRGTPESLKMTLKWANIDNITIIEEPHDKHFFELQIGIKDVPNNFFVDTVIALFHYLQDQD